ncbi:MAG: PilZ domain-containing protein [Candidatus Omnitrophota bacterium]
MYEEKRRYPRLDINVNINWKKVVENTASDTVVRGVSKNISEGGICLIVYERLNIGDVVVLDIELPVGKVIKSRGKVAWVKDFEIIGREKGYDVGVELIDISQQDRDILRNFVFKLLNK